MLRTLKDRSAVFGTAQHAKGSDASEPKKPEEPEPEEPKPEQPKPEEPTLPTLGKRKAFSTMVAMPQQKVKRVPLSKALLTLDELALASVDMSPVPFQHRTILRRAMAELDLSKCKPLKTQWGESKRLQATFGTADCVIRRYNFSRLDNPILPATGNMLALLELGAQRLQVNSKSVIGHINYYPKGTSAGCSAHQDNEECIDQAYPIIGYQVGGPATFHVWSGRPAGRAGASTVIDESQTYLMKAGFQQHHWHAITRTKSNEKGTCRYNITFRVVQVQTPLK